MAKNNNPWFRAYTEMVDDEKLRLLAFEDRWHFIALLCCKGAGLLDTADSPDLTRRKVALKLGLAPRELDEAARRLAEVGLIDPDTFQPIAWNVRQFKSDSSTERVKAYRERKQRRNVSVTTQETETETETEAEAEAEAERKKKRARSAPVLPEWLPPDAWADWHAHRRQATPKSWTSKAQQLSLSTLSNLHSDGHAPRAVIYQSIERGWTGLFPLRSKDDRNDRNDHRRKPSLVERMRAVAIDAERRDAAAAVGYLGAHALVADG